MEGTKELLNAEELKIKDVLELLKAEGATVASVSKQIQGISEKPLRKLLKDAGFDFSNKGVKGWFYVAEDGAEADALERMIKDKATVKERTNGTRKARTNKPANAQKIETTNEQKKEPNNVIRKRYSFDLDVNLMKKLKVHAVLQDVNIYEIVEESIKEYMQKVLK